VRPDTAVRRLRTIAERCSQVSRTEPVLRAAHAFGQLLDGRVDVEVVQVAFVLDLPPEQLPWCAEPRGCGWLVELLELGKAPVVWYWRPAAWPVANHVVDRPVRFWSAQTGTDEPALRALAGGQIEQVRPAPPAAADLRVQLQVELAASLAHLRQTHAGYWQRDWRAAHRGGGTYPEQHLHNAVHGYLDLLNATDHINAEPDAI
jgi:hypothetical protein